MNNFIIGVYYQQEVENTSWPEPILYKVISSSIDEAFNKVSKDLYERECEADEEYGTFTSFENFDKYSITRVPSSQKGSINAVDEEGYVIYEIVESIELS